MRLPDGTVGIGECYARVCVCVCVCVVCSVYVHGERYAACYSPYKHANKVSISVV